MFAGIALATVAGLALLAPVTAIPQSEAPSADWQDSLKAFLQEYSAPPPGFEDSAVTTRYAAAYVDLNDDGTDEVIVHLRGRQWCGTGGCTTQVLARNDSSYRVISQIPTTELPIRVFESKSNGWHDIGVGVRGWQYVNGREAPYDALLPFDGETYPRNKFAPPARRAGPDDVGKIVIDSSDEGLPLYPQQE